MPREEVRRSVEDYLAWEVITDDATSVVEALDIEKRYKISYWDALAIRAAWHAGAAALYSEDLAEGQSYESLRVVNPLRTGAESYQPN